MKKFLWALASFFFLNSTQALALQEGKQYIELEQPRSVQPEVIEFFSFGCIHCFNFEKHIKFHNKLKLICPKMSLSNNIMLIGWAKILFVLGH